MLSIIYMKNVHMQTPLFYFYLGHFKLNIHFNANGKRPTSLLCSFPSSIPKFLPKNTYGQQGLPGAQCNSIFLL